MSWVIAFRIIAAAIISAGGIGVIFVGVIKFSADKISERLCAKYQIKLNKELEHYKSDLSKKEYVSKTRFDAEFQTYRELSRSFYDMVINLNTLTVAIYNFVPSTDMDYEKRREYCWKRTIDCLDTAQSTLGQNSPFISEELYEKYSEITALTRTQIENFYDHFSKVSSLTKDDIKRLQEKDEVFTSNIEAKYEKLLSDVRNYISTLEVLE